MAERKTSKVTTTAWTDGANPTTILMRDEETTSVSTIISLADAATKTNMTVTSVSTITSLADAATKTNMTATSVSTSTSLADAVMTAKPASTITSSTEAVTEMASTDIAGPTQDGCSEEGRTKTKKKKKKKYRVSFDEGSLERTADPEEASVAQLRSALEEAKLEDEGSLELTAISEGETVEGYELTKGERERAKIERQTNELCIELCVEFDQEPVTALDWEHRKGCIDQAQRKSELMDELEATAVGQLGDLRTVKEERTSLDFENKVTDNIEGRGIERLSRLWRNGHCGNAYWFPAYERDTTMTGVKWRTKRDAQGQIINKLVSNMEQTEILRPLDTEDRKAAHRIRQQRIHQEKLNRRNTKPKNKSILDSETYNKTYKDSTQYGRSIEGSLPYEDFRTWTERMSKVHPWILDTMEAIQSTAKSRADGLELERRSISPQDLVKWREHRNNFSETLQIIDIRALNKAPAKCRLLYQMAASCPPDPNDALATYRHHLLCKEAYKQIAEGMDTRPASPTPRDARINSTILPSGTTRGSGRSAEPTELYEYHEQLMELARLNLAINHMARKASEDEMVANYKMAKDETLALHHINVLRIEGDIMTQPFAASADNPNKTRI